MSFADLLIRSRREWVDRGPCTDLSYEDFERIFYAEKNGEAIRKNKAARWDEAAEYCGSCPVQAECLEWALNEESGGPARRFGFVGGRAPEERMNIAENRRRQAARQAAKASA